MFAIGPARWGSAGGCIVQGFASLLSAAAVLAATVLSPGSAFAAATQDAPAEAEDAAAASTRATLARRVLSSQRITLATFHPSGVVDNANARKNIVDTAHGGRAHRSCYGTAPCGSVYLNVSMLRGMLELRNSYMFRVSEIAGGSHSPGSRHYAGKAFDVDIIDGQSVSASNAHFRGFMQHCRAQGATEVLGPGDVGHATHIHCGWP
jgi:zinc D-Ala-D-Ala carboxypeptidase